MYPTQKTLVLIKPDAVQRGLIHEVLKRFEQKGLKIIGTKMIQFDDDLLREHYAHVLDRPFYPELSVFMSSGPSIALVIEGIEAIKEVRHIAGLSAQDRGSIRGDLTSSNQKNLIHTSDSLQNAAEEIPRFFATHELFQYDKDAWKFTYAQSDIPASS